MSRTLVIGGGVIGLCSAYALHRRGESVTVLEAGEPGAACSWGNMGWVVPTWSGPLPAPGVVGRSLRWMLRSDSPLFIRPRLDPEFAAWLWGFWRHCNARAHDAGFEAIAGLNARTMELYDALVADGVEFEMHREGLLFLCLTRAGMDHIRADLARLSRYGYPEPRPLSGDEVRDVEPGVSRDVIGGFLADRERHVRPETLTAGLVKRLGALGVAVRPGVAVTGLRRRGTAVTAVETPEGPITADRYLIAAGAWSAALVGMAGHYLPVQAGKGYSITIRNPAFNPRHPIELSEVRAAVSGYRGALRIGGTMELSGLNCDLDPRRVRAIRRAADWYLADWRRGEGEVEWVGMRPIAPDGLPVIGRIPTCDNLYVATGHAMLGVTLGPATAAATAELICDGRSSVDLAPFDPARFRQGWGALRRPRAVPVSRPTP